MKDTSAESIELKRLSELSLTAVQLSDSFWKPKQELNRNVTLPHQYEKLDTTGRIENFRRVARGERGSYEGMFFNDSDVYKWIEAASYAIAESADPWLGDKLAFLVPVIISAQEADGYLNTYFSLNEPDKKWTNLGMMSELYCAGHFFQAAVAHFEATGERGLLAAAIRFADLIDRIFRVENRNGAPGHEEIELALVSLYRVTHERRYLQLATEFVERRGSERSAFRSEIKKLDQIGGYGYQSPVENIGARNVEQFYEDFYLGPDGEYDGSYAQDHVPVVDQDSAEGHAVRAMYLYSGVADLLLENENQEFLEATR